MLRFLTLILLFLLASISIYAQDTLYKTNHEKVIVKVQQVGPDEIIYKRYTAPDGPLYVISTSDVMKIVYIDGHVDLFTYEIDYDADTKSYPVHRWAVGINAFDLMFGMISLSGEYTSEKNNLSIRVPLSCGLGAMEGKDPLIRNGYPDYFYYSQDKIFSTGVDLRFYPAKQKRMTNYYLGVSFEYGMVNYKYQYYSGYPYYYVTSLTQIASYTGTGITNGILIKASEHINVGIDFTMGMMVTSVENSRDYNPMARFGINMLYRFGK